MTERATEPRDAAAAQREREDAADQDDGGTIAREERIQERRTEARGHDTADRTTGEAALFERSTASDLERRWQEVQAGFVDEPRKSVERADKLVAEVLDQLTSSFASERRNLEGAWSGGRDASTEDLRQAIRRYRSFFNRLLAV